MLLIVKQNTGKMILMLIIRNALLVKRIVRLVPIKRIVPSAWEATFYSNLIILAFWVAQLILTRIL